jgi:hypothetical protein
MHLWLRVLAYNPGNPWRRLVLPRRIDLQQRLVKTGGRLVKHARYYARYYFLHSPGLNGWIDV